MVWNTQRFHLFGWILMSMFTEWKREFSQKHAMYTLCRTFLVCLTLNLGSSLILFILIGRKLFYNIVVVFAIHQHESPLGVQVSHHPEPPIPSLWVAPEHWL